ncbi:integrase [Paraburkholderia hospita]|uniref:Integrase n=1 Tax=Paraburkholderia hospita TaxID=169430 RepID=A0AAN1JMX2_9BURK|nr:tyrosine-type recombinase/integrase [Paraburkholderia hospita]AUT75887.1 integrase [Paraburkholderia hospita]
MNGEELQDLLSRYLEHRELLGYRHTHRGILARFVQDHVIEHPGESIRTIDVLEWVTRVRRAPPSQSATLSALRGFLRFVKAVDPATSVPDNHLLPSPRRSPPYILSEEQLQSILCAATTARPRGGLRADAYVAVLGLLASSGLRISEALHLKATDVHLRDEPPHVVVRETKFKKSRIVPLHPTTAAHLKQYADRREHKCHARRSTMFFVTDFGQALDQNSLWRWFSCATAKLGLHLPDGRRPTLHSLRHSFAVHRLTQWYEDGASAAELAPTLSVYLGHVSPRESYWYVSSTPGLLGCALNRFAAFADMGDQS